MNKNNILKVIGGFFGCIVAAMILIFLPAGTVGFDKGWVLMGLIFVPMLMVAAMLLSSSPESLVNCFQVNGPRPLAKETKGLAICGGFTLLVFVLTGLSYRLKWMQVEGAGFIIGIILFIAGYALFIESVREKNWVIRSSSSIDDLDICDTGVHGFIRQPMYASLIFIFMGIPLMLGSMIGFLVSLLCPVLVVIRIITWEKTLEAELPGYTDYEDIIKYRLIPFIW